MALCFIEAELRPIAVLHCAFSTFFCSGDLELYPMTFIYKLYPYSLEIYRCVKINFMPQIFRVLSYYSLRLCAFSYAWSLRSRDKDDGHTIRSATVEYPVLDANIMALSVIEPELWAIEVLHCKNRNF